MSNRHYQDIAAALIDTAIEAGNVPLIVQHIGVIAELFSKDASFKQNISETIIPFEQRTQALKRAIGDQIHPFVTHAILLLISKQSLDEYDAFCEQVRKLAAEKGNHREVQVISVQELDEKEKAHIQKKLEEKWNGTIELKTKCDPSILGGLKLSSGTWFSSTTVTKKSL
jgi:F-type H+-transporting ATPase subunit delta